MSGKRAKKQRKEIQDAVYSINIVVLKDGGMSITGFPTNPVSAMDIMGTAIKAMAHKMAEMSRLREAPRVLPAKKPIFGIDGKPIN